MSKLVNINIDLTKVDKARIFKGDKGQYLSLDVWINDTPNQYGKDVDVCHSPTKEERDAKAKKIYVGNGKTVFGFDDAPRPRQQPARQSTPGAADAEDGDAIPW